MLLFYNYHNKFQRKLSGQGRIS